MGTVAHCDQLSKVSFVLTAWLVGPVCSVTSSSCADAGILGNRGALCFPF